ncbi:MAG: ribosomal protein S18-alanine N-acetyltransferase [Acidobacteria bacterium]|nr:ribosomal protein S18-alanine N-acetyltransferase [Acidobacteriota bacterium]
MKPLKERKAEPSAMRFREYEPGDFSRLCELDRICFPSAMAYDPEEIAAALLQPRAFCVVAEQDDQVVGFILLDYRRSVGHITTIDLHPDYRRRGLGGHLMEMGEQRLLKRGVRRVVLEVAVGNDPAIAFYQGRGFARQRLLRHYYRDGSDAYLMEKSL